MIMEQARGGNQNLGRGAHGKDTETSGPEAVSGISVGVAKKVVRD
jgi:hypothetical protein